MPNEEVQDERNRLRVLVVSNYGEFKAIVLGDMLNDDPASRFDRKSDRRLPANEVRAGIHGRIARRGLTARSDDRATTAFALR